MTVGLLGMAFKAESDDIRSSLSYKLKRLLQAQGRPGAVHRPLRDRRRRTSTPLDVVLEQADLLVVGAPHRAYAVAGPDRCPVRRHLERAARRARLRDAPRISVVVPCYNEGDDITGFLDQLFDSITMPCEVLAVYDSPDDTTLPHLESYADKDPRLVPTLNTYGPGPGQCPKLGLDHAEADIIVVTMADGSDDPQQVEALARLVERGVVVAAASRYVKGGQQVGGPFLKRIMSRRRRAVALLVRPGRHPRRHELLQGLRPRLRAPGRASSPTPASSSASRWWPRPGATASRSPSCPPSGSTARSASPTSRSGPGSPATCGGTATPSGRGCRDRIPGVRRSAGPGGTSARCRPWTASVAWRWRWWSATTSRTRSVPGEVLFAGTGPVPGGFLGVDVFFVLSGFLITALLLGEQDRGGGIAMGRFYGRRALRLLPALYLVLLVHTAYAWATGLACAPSG